LQIELGPGCSYDFIRIAGVVYCGTHEIQRAFDLNELVSGATIEIELVTDYIVDDVGAALYWTLSGMSGIEDRWSSILCDAFMYISALIGFYCSAINN